MKRLLARLVMWLIRDELLRVVQGVTRESQQSVVRSFKADPMVEVDEASVRACMDKLREEKARGTW